MYYSDSYFNQPNPFAVQQPQQQQQGMQVNPMQALQAYQTFAGGGAGGSGGLSGLFGGGAAGGTGAATGGSSAGGAGASALASNPVGWIAAAALGQNVAHNKGISSWQAGLKGQGGANIGDYYMKEKWGMEEDDPLYDAAGVLGFGSGGGVLNPSYLSKKIFGKVD